MDVKVVIGNDTIRVKAVHKLMNKPGSTLNKSI